MSEEALRLYAELTQEICLCQDEDIKKLGKAVLELADNYDKTLKEKEELKSKIDKAYDYLDKFIPNEYGVLLTERQWQYVKDILKENE